MTDTELRVANLIRDAFQGVRLGNGVGLFEAQGLDERSGSETLKRYRAGDEKDDWSRIAKADLEGCDSSLSFFDQEGMRFHLPAYLIADLEESSGQILWHLCYVGHNIPPRFALLNRSQRHAVREFLWLRLAEPDREFERPMIEHVLLEYWMTPEDE